jgi:Protein of unknown function (DUF2817)
MAVREQAAYSLRKGLGTVGCWPIDPLSGKRTMAFDLRVFSSTYAEARASFLEAARAARLQIWSYPHPLPGLDGEAVALDVALAGSPAAKKLLVVSSAVHGVEGFCGSGVQVHALRHAAWLAQAPTDELAVLYLHAVNPWGFSHLRRVTHENVDLNRNFADFSQPLPQNPGYRALHDTLLPQQWPPTPEVQARLQQFIATQGLVALQAAVSSGQYEFKNGLFYGGHEATWSHRVLRLVLREHTAQAQHLAWVDLHSGLGPSGHGERIFSDPRGDAATVARAQAWWGNGGRTPITRAEDGSSVSSRLNGTLATCLEADLAHTQSTKITIEFGTVPPLHVLQALRADQWLYNHPGQPAALANAIRSAMRDAFFVDTDLWKTQVLDQSLQAMGQAVAGLRNSG